MDAEMYTRVHHKVFVVNAGAHLWMTADMRDVITQNYAQTVCQFQLPRLTICSILFAIRYDAYEPETLVLVTKVGRTPMEASQRSTP
jgi:hypothetical protein